MGAESSTYQDLQMDGEIPLPGERGWSIHDAHIKDEVRVSVFLHKSPADSDLLQNAAKQLKTLRHPSILKFLALNRTSAGHKLVTEPVTPLEIVIENLTAAEVASGLYNILEALIFLHDRVGMCHNNVSLSSIFVGEDGNWRLGGMEYVCYYKDVTPEYLSKYKSKRDESALAPEEKSGKLDLTPDRYHARDTYSFGVMSELLLESMSDLGDLTKTFELRIQDELLHPEPKKRPKLHTLLNDRLFSNGFLEIIHFLQHITLKSDVEKKDFFSLLIDRLHEMPTELVGTRLTKLLLSRFVLLDPTAVECLIPHLLTPYQGKVMGESQGNVRPLFSTGEFVKYVIPELFKIFHVRDAHIRLVLLSQFTHYARLFNKSNLQTVILPQLLLGLRDLNDELVEASLRCLAELVPIIGGDLVIGSHRGKIFSEGKPKFVQRGGNGIKMNKAIEQEVGVLVQSNTPSCKSKVKDSKTLKEMAKEHDREKRRAEAASKNEERRRKREERSRQLEGKTKEKNRENLNRSLATQNVEDTDFRENDDTMVGHSSVEGLEDKWTDWDQKDDVVITSKDTSIHDVNDTSEEDEDNDFDQEIEDELRAMDSHSRQEKVNERFEPEPQVSVDWSDAPLVDRTRDNSENKTRGMLKLKSKSKLSPPPIPKSTPPNDNDWGDGDWGYQEDSHHALVTPRKSASPKSKISRSRQTHVDIQGQQDGWIDDWGNNDLLKEGSSPSTSPVSELTPEQSSKLKSQTKEKSEKELGAEFDIMSIKVKAKKAKEADPFDFFSDMEPVIPVKNPLAELLERSHGQVKGETLEEKFGSKSSDNQTPSPQGKNDVELADCSHNKISFAVMETNEDDVEVGWGDDDWEDPEALITDDLQT